MRLGDAADLSVASAPAELLVGLVRELTLTAWALRGTPLPTYRREDMPGRVLRRSTEPTP